MGSCRGALEVGDSVVDWPGEICNVFLFEKLPYLLPNHSLGYQLGRAQVNRFHAVECVADVFFKKNVTVKNVARVELENFNEDRKKSWQTTKNLGLLFLSDNFGKKTLKMVVAIGLKSLTSP